MPYSKEVSDSVLARVEKKIFEVYDLLRGHADSGSYYLLNFLLVMHKEDMLRVSYVGDPSLKEQIRADFYRYLKSSNVNGHDGLMDALDHQLDKVSDEIFGYVAQEVRSIPIEELRKHIKYIFDLVLQHNARSQGIRGLEGYQPEELSRVMSSLYQLKPNAEVYNPFGGFASLGIPLPEKVNYLGQELNSRVWAMGKLRLIAHGLDDSFEFQLGDSISNWNPEGKKIDLILSSPPFGLRLRTQDVYRSFHDHQTAEAYTIEKSIESLAAKGKAIIAVTNNFLFGRGGREADLREQIIENDLLEMVISFPGGILYNTSIPFNLVVLNKAKEEVKYLKTVRSNSLSAICSLSTILRKLFSCLFEIAFIISST